MQLRRALSALAIVLASSQVAAADPKPAAAFGAAVAASSQRNRTLLATNIAIRPKLSPSLASSAGDTVVEIWPGGGWYTEILAPYLKDKGTLYAVAPIGE